jgi:hypothetical protein
MFREAQHERKIGKEFYFPVALSSSKGERVVFQVIFQTVAHLDYFEEEE